MLYCMSDCTFSICLRGCVCAHVCLCDGGGGRAGIKHTRSTSQRLGGPSPALMATHVNPTTQKIGQWNTTHSRTQMYTHMHQVSTQRITVCQSRQCLVARLRPYVQHCHAHLPAEQTRPLDWNNRIKNGAERNSDSEAPHPLCDPLPPPSLHATSHLCHKNFCSEDQELFASRDVATPCKDYTSCGFHSTPRTQ